MIHSDAEKLLELFNPRIEAFGMCLVGKNQALRVSAADQLVIHCVLSGHGSLVWGEERRALLPGTIALIPKNFSKIIAGEGAIRSVTEATDTCVLADGLLEFATPELDDDQLVLCCAKVSERVGAGTGLFDGLLEPLVEPQDPKMAWAFDGILSELSSQEIGSKAIINAFLKQIMVLAVRKTISREGLFSPLLTGVMDPQIAPLINAIILRPGDRYSVESMSRKVGMSTSGLNQKFEQALGQSPSDYVRHMRLRASKNMLVDTTLPVKTIAGAVGFASRSHFSRAFLKVYGMDPSSYRLASTTNVVGGH